MVRPERGAEKPARFSGTRRLGEEGRGRLRSQRLAFHVRGGVRHSVGCPGPPSQPKGGKMTGTRSSPGVPRGRPSPSTAETGPREAEKGASVECELQTPGVHCGSPQRKKGALFIPHPRPHSPPAKKNNLPAEAQQLPPGSM